MQPAGELELGADIGFKACKLLGIQAISSCTASHQCSACACASASRGCCTAAIILQQPCKASTCMHALQQAQHIMEPSSAEACRLQVEGADGQGSQILHDWTA